MLYEILNVLNIFLVILMLSVQARWVLTVVLFLGTILQFIGWLLWYRYGTGNGNDLANFMAGYLFLEILFIIRFWNIAR